MPVSDNPSVLLKFVCNVSMILINSGEYSERCKIYRDRKCLYGLKIESKKCKINRLQFVSFYH